VNELMCLEFESQQIRVVGTPDAPEWVAVDVCNVLGLKDPSNILRHFKTTERGMYTIHTTRPGGEAQQVLTVTEPGLYRLIFKSRKPEADRFRTWITHEVLPSIRRHGCYPPPEIAVRDAAIIRIDEDALVRGLGKALNASIVPRIDNLDTRVERLTGETAALRDEVSRISNRQPLKPQTQRAHIQVVLRMYSCKCPCCGITTIVNDNGERMPTLEFDHWRLRSQNSIQLTWPICQACNRDLRDPEFKDQCEVHFQSYQTRRKQLEKIISPLLPGMDE